MEFGYATLLAQVIPVIGVALILEMRQLEQHLKPAEDDPKSLRRRVIPQIMPVLSFLAMTALAVSEGFALWAASGSQISHLIELLIMTSLVFAIFVTFLLSPVLWLARLYGVSPLVTAIIQVVALLSFIGIIIFVAFQFAVANLQDIDQPHYQSGDEPAVDHYPPRICPVACPPGPDTAAYQWSLDPRTRASITTTFSDQDEFFDFHYDHTRGTLQYVPDDSCQGRIEWMVQADGSSPITGILDDKQRKAPFNVPIVKQPEKITISAQRTDNQPCTIAFRWDDPRRLIGNSA